MMANRAGLWLRHWTYVLSRRWLLAASVLVCMGSISACETGYLWSLDALGFNQRDSYVNSLGAARDSVAELSAALERHTQGSSRKPIRRAQKAVQTSQAYSGRLADAWLSDWQQHPERFDNSVYNSGQARVLVDEVLTQVQSLLAQSRELSSTDEASVVMWQQRAESWHRALEGHIVWLESSTSGYPLPEQ